ncbi:MAG: ATP phosphoribosyltransferase [Candidatus Omnitrophica bacterium 4484_70.1]|nr:MAG: ATP phosphoribosyltransferase [Candidatus Omnitrophica bacterium 4484_70.1]
MKRKIISLGLPKGSLEVSTFELFRMAGFKIFKEERSYFPSIDDPKIKPVLLRPQEIPRYVEEGVLDCGITGEDWILENEAKVVAIGELLYAKKTAQPVRWVVAVRENSSIRNLAQLEGKRIATELVNFTRKFFKKKKIKVEVEFSWGATEAKVNSGLVDAVVELTETGTSLKANGLREIACICVSATKFIANKSSYRDKEKRKKMESVFMLLKGALEAKNKVGLKLNVEKKNLKKILKILPALKNPTISNLAIENWVACEVVIDEEKVKELIPKLKEAGACDIIEYPLNKLIY